MSLGVSITTPAAKRGTGSSRSASFLWPQSPDLGNTQGTFSKINGNTTANMMVNTALNSGGLGAIEEINGLSAVKVTTAAAVNASGETFKWAIRPFLLRVQPLFNLPHPFLVAEIGALICVDSYAAQVAERGTDDIGVSLLDNFGSLVNGNLAKGIHFGPVAKGVVRLRSRNTAGGGLQVDEVATLPAGFDASKWNYYSLRIVGATASSEAIVQGFINGVAATTRRKWVTDSLPAPTTTPSFAAMTVCCMSSFAGGGVIHHAQSYYNAAASEDDI